MKKIIFNVIKFGLVAGILYYLISSGQLNFDLLNLFLEQPATLFTLWGVFIFVIVPVAAFRWWFLLRAIGLRVPVLRTNILTWIGNFFNITLPGSISGDVVKGFYIIQAQEKEGKTPAFTTLLIDRFVGLFGLIVMAFVALIFNFEFIQSQKPLIPLAMMISGLFLGTIVFYGIVLFPFKEGKDPFIRLFNKLPGKKTLIKVYSAFKRYQHQKPTLVLTLLMAIVNHCAIAFIFFEISKMIGITELDLATQFFIMPIGLIAISIPIAPGGIGVGHAAFGELYRLVGVSGGADIFNLFWIIQFSVFLLGGILYLLYNNEFKMPKSEDLDML